MRAVVVRQFGPFENAELAEVPKPEAKAGEVLLKVRATSVNFVDLIMIGGTYQFKPELPFIPGKLPAGVVAAVGAGVKNFKPGDHAIAMAEQGGFAEFVAMPESQCIKLPPSLPFAEAAAMALIYDTAYFALRDRARLAPGETVLVLGATGGVGLAAIQLAKAFGARVLAGVASADKTDIVRAAGADAVIDLARSDLHDALRAQVYAETAGRGADVILDMLGGDIFDAAIRALAWRGRLVVIGFASGRIATLKTNYVLLKNIEVSGMQISDYRKRMPEAMQKCFTEVFALHAAGKLKPLPVKTYPLREFVAAMREIADRKVRGRVVLTMANGA
ncbi:MAG TPA: NADPH:quinone oxidoreductase family protein [Xanthobacteraceae bacterium]|nr:NADPH:quinone oxidoreductase family protein [Xanthobacteraceae bacterium]